MIIQQKGTVLLQFSADWCAPCRTMQPTIEKFRTKSDVVFQKIDVDTETKIAQKYGVRNIPCFIVLKDGIAVGRQVGTQSVAQLLELVK
jgi:thioredoxin 1